VVDAGNFPLQIFYVIEHVEVAQERRGANLHRMAEADAAYFGLAQDAAGQGAHGIGIV
jgi:hypothetical protein